MFLDSYHHADSDGSNRIPRFQPKKTWWRKGGTKETDIHF